MATTTNVKTICDCRTRTVDCLSEATQRSKLGLVRDFLLDLFESFETQESTILTKLAHMEDGQWCRKKSADPNRLSCDGSSKINILEATIANDKDTYEVKCDTVKTIYKSQNACQFNSTALKDLVAQK